MMESIKRLDRPPQAGRCKPGVGKPKPTSEKNSPPEVTQPGDNTKSYRKQPNNHGKREERKVSKRVERSRVTRKKVKDDQILESIENTLQQAEGEIDATHEFIHDSVLAAVDEHMRKFECEQFKDADNDMQLSEPSKTDDELVCWTAFRMEVRNVCDMLYGDARRSQKINTHKNAFIHKHNVRRWNDWADKCSAIINEELQRTDAAVPYITRWKHNYYHACYDSIWSIVNLPYLVLGFGVFMCLLLSTVIVGLLVGYKTIQYLPTLAIGAGVIYVYHLVQPGRKNPRNVSVTVKQIADTCCKAERAPSNSIHPQADIKTINVDWRCIPRETWVGITTAPDYIWKARNCAHNEYRSLVKRQLLLPIGEAATRSAAWKLASDKFRQWSQWMSVGDFLEVTPEDESAFLSRYPKGRRLALARSFEEKLAPNIYTATKAFVKTNEWNTGKSFIKMDPRCISGKDDGYLAECVGYWIWTKQNLHIFMNEDHTKRYSYAGGMSDVDIGAWLQFQLDSGYNVYEGDFSRFDGRNEVEAIEAEIALYTEKMMSGEIAKAVSAQIDCGGRTGHGIRYKCPGKVCSGVINTSFGNSLRNMMIITYILETYSSDWRVLVNGDDNIIVTRHNIDVNHVVARARDLGHDLDLVYREDADYTEFCSKRFYPTLDGLVLGPKLGRFFAKTLMPHRAMPEKEVPEHLKQVVTGFWHFRGLPGLDVLMSQHRVKAASNQVLAEWQITPGNFELDPDRLGDFIFKIYNLESWQITGAASQYDWTKPGQYIYDDVFDRLSRVDGVYDDMSDIRISSIAIH